MNAQTSTVEELLQFGTAIGLRALPQTEDGVIPFRSEARTTVIRVQVISPTKIFIDDDTGHHEIDSVIRARNYIYAV